MKTSKAAWEEWFGKMGKRATPEVINATSTLVLAEREIYQEPQLKAVGLTDEQVQRILKGESL